jgi:ketosteroid isomerase-like protein
MQSGEPVELVREAFERWADGDYERLQEFLLATSTADVELRSRLGSFGGESYHGHDGIRAWLTEIQESFERFMPWQDEVRAAGADRVVAVGGISFRARESGVDMDVPWGWVFEFRDGKLGQMHFYASAREALEAAELGG